MVDLSFAQSNLRSVWLFVTKDFDSQKRFDWLYGKATRSYFIRTLMSQRQAVTGLIVLILVSGFEQVSRAQALGQSAALVTCGAKPVRVKFRLLRAIR